MSYLSPVRLLILLPVLLIMAVMSGCGKEAPPRATKPTPGSDDQPTMVLTRPTIAEMPAETTTPMDEQGAATLPQDARALGDPNAPITIIEYGDYQ